MFYTLRLSTIILSHISISLFEVLFLSPISVAFIKSYSGEGALKKFDPFLFYSYFFFIIKHDIRFINTVDLTKQIKIVIRVYLTFLACEPILLNSMSKDYKFYLVQVNSADIIAKIPNLCNNGKCSKKCQFFKSANLWDFIKNA